MNKPNYNNCITNLSNSILYHFGVKPFHNTLPEIDKAITGKKKVIVFLFDGMGKVVLEKHLPEDSFFGKNIILNIKSTLPPTTVASTTSFLSGKFPIETGWLGWSLYFKDYNRNIDVFTNADDQTGEIVADKNIMTQKAPYKTIAELINEANQKEIANLIFGYPVDKQNRKVKRLKSFVKYAYKQASMTGESFTYAYWIAPDCFMHKYGVTHKIVHRNILKIQKYIKRYSKKYNDVATLVIADHGMKDVVWENMDEHPDLVETFLRPISIEKRCANFFIKKGKEKTFEILFKKYYGNHYDLIPMDEVLKNGLFGDSKPSNISLEFLGQYLAVATDEVALECASQKSKKKIPFIGHHAGTTLDEFDISVIGINTNIK